MGVMKFVAASSLPFFPILAGDDVILLMLVLTATFLICGFLVRNKTAMNSWGATDQECAQDRDAIATYAITIFAPVGKVSENLRSQFQLGLGRDRCVAAPRPIDRHITRLTVRRYRCAEDLSSPLKITKDFLRGSVWYDAFAMLVMRRRLFEVKRISEYRPKSPSVEF